jgi:phthiocerol/phenolphthiocerol synthesis type-I polyketide synthase C
MDPIREDLLESLAGLSSHSPDARLVSTVTGEAVKAEAFDAEYWWRNVRNPVLFAEAAAQLIGEDYRIFLEIGPRSVLKSYLVDALRSAAVHGRVLASLSRKQGDDDPFPGIAAHCYVAGYDWAATTPFDGPADPRGLPLYPWKRERFWFQTTTETRDLISPPFDHPLLGFRQPGATTCWLNHLDAQVLPWIGDHEVEGVAVLPAAAVLEIALAAARWRWPEASALEVLDVEVRRPLPFDQGRMRELRTSLGPEDEQWELASRPRLSSEPLTVHAVGRICAATDARRILCWSNGGPVRQRIEGEQFYRLVRLTGLDYGSRFRTVTHIEVVGPDSAIAYLDPSAVGEALDPYLIHPALLDGALQGLFGLLADRQYQMHGAGFLPWRFGRVRLLPPFARMARRAHLRLSRIGVRSVSADIVLFDDAGDIIAELADCWFRRVELIRRHPVDERALRVDLVPAPLGELCAPAAPIDFGATLSHLAAAREPDQVRQEQALLLDVLIGSAAFEALEKLVEPGRFFTVSELAASGQIATDSVPIAERLLRLLRRFGAASEAEFAWRLEPTTDLPAVTEVWRLLLAEAPDLVAELALVAAAVEDLPEILVSGTKQVEAQLSPMVEQLLQASPASASGIELLSEALGELATAWPKARPLRILELGASGGGATRRILSRLAQSGVALTYTAASTDSEQAQRLSSLARSFVGVSACRWSPEDGNDALNGAMFDIILAVNACARLQLDAASFAGLRDLLASGGFFVAVEAEPNPLWDIVFGQDASWWGPASRTGDWSPLRSAEDWRTELAAAGFQSTCAAPATAPPWPSALFWGSAPPRAAAVPVDLANSTAVTLVTRVSVISAALQDRLAAAGYRVATVQSAGLLDSTADDAPARSEEGTREIVVFLVEEPGKDADPIGQISQQIAALARLAPIAGERQAALWVVTCEAQQATLAHQARNLVGGALWSLGRVLANEMPHLSIRLLDLPGAAAPEERARQIAVELTAASAETEVVWTPQGRHVPRLRQGIPPRWAKASDELSVVTSHFGGLDALGWEARAPRPVGPGEVEIEVHAAGLNFRDVMWAMGLLPEESLIDGFAGPTFGLECAGIVRSLGPGVSGLSVGDRVMAFAPASFSSRAVTLADAVAPIPPNTSFAEAATIPVAFVTAIYALGHLAKLSAGEYVLIHSASGGVGLAAIQYAKQRGAVVIATAGSEVRRAFLRLAGADYVVDSRNVVFGDAVRAFTGGQGVDIVLNSLSGEAMERSLEVLKPFGRFLELGKRDLYLNRRIHLRPLRQNISYFAIDIDQLPTRRPDLARLLLAEVSAALSEGAIRPLAHRIFCFAELGDAFRLMQSASHIGKIVLVPRANAGVQLSQSPEITLRRHGTYLVTGGIEGFGYECARWLAAQGAGSIALVGRRGAATPGCAARVADLEATGAEVRVYQGDVADRGSLAIVLDAIRANGPPLRGIVHAASAIDDGLVAEIDLTRIAPIMRPKLGGAINLDALTRNDPIELFLLFSSATTLVGAPGQGVYVATNMALESLARQRRAEGKPALAIAWGPIEDAGYLAERPTVLDALARRLGARPVPAAQALAGLSAMVASGLAVVAFADTDWADARRFLPILATPLFSDGATASSAPVDESLAEQLVSMDAEAALALLKTVVAEEAAKILRLPGDGIDPSRPLSEMGMDSLMAVELRLALENRLRIDLPLVSLTEGTSVTSIAARLAAAALAAPRNGEVIALVARHELGDDPRSLTDPDRAAAE